MIETGMVLSMTFMGAAASIFFKRASGSEGFIRKYWEYYALSLARYAWQCNDVIAHEPLCFSLYSRGGICFAFLKAFEKYKLLSKPTELAIAVIDRFECRSR